MLAGTHFALDIAGQATIALWALKTAMVLEGLDPPAMRGYSQDEREQLHTLSAIPIRTSVWLAAAVVCGDLILHLVFMSQSGRCSGI